MTERVREICSKLTGGKKLADVGCDHGYMARYALFRGLYEKVYISDVSAGSLKKAERLLKSYLEAGSCVSVLADGMKGLPPDCDWLLIAGLGGEEIMRILKEGYLPERFVLQPMKNAEKLRRYLVGEGALIEEDYTFGEGYYYDLIVGRKRGGSEYTEREFLYGRDNLLRPGPPFLHKLLSELQKTEGYLCRELGQESLRELKERERELKEVIDETRKNLLGRG